MKRLILIPAILLAACGGPLDENGQPTVNLNDMIKNWERKGPDDYFLTLKLTCEGCQSPGTMKMRIKDSKVVWKRWVDNVPHPRDADTSDYMSISGLLKSVKKEIDAGRRVLVYYNYTDGLRPFEFSIYKNYTGNYARLSLHYTVVEMTIVNPRRR